ncbi:glycosyltransferase family 4 protein [Cytobacillus oceanisediminis]|uniref:glycosyltransferase family 4 protein n=1 Tax=Cytobacillus TaxID=2675230 RepID=UPI00203F05B2|nr:MULTISPECIES: glycosyltransferase family 4 protein [Cytobacillus]MBY0158841.1 glycosyltransferase family 4 protein [Cytobacillus firmus]MCM3391496.1 glycosyltransferase family 4 protein [Cytobacillus oceanisediminis]MCM3529089.1 glycosyltransferase family 4 protein [Cytobacillus oceanisediminis]UQX53794.1 glycosyltransferase family 4 protein [Cytobacillus pseudoceanisediminis]
MKKVLFVATVVKAHIMVFHIPYLKWFKENGFETYVCAKNDYEDNEKCEIPYCDNYYDIPFERAPLKLKNIKAYKQLKELIENNEFDIIHCHTPIGGALSRLAARDARKNGTTVIYTAHGFHFYKGAPFINWLLYYPVERLLAGYTDVLITINKEDYNRAKKFKAKKIEYVPGVGIDTMKYSEISVNKKDKPSLIGIPQDSLIVVSVGELNKNKNHEVIIKALANLNNKKIYYVICGQGPLNKHLKELAKELGVKEQVKLLGFRKDIIEICKAADIFAFPSYREGLSVSLMEAMASGLPVVCSDIRGNYDLIEEEKGGYLVKASDIEGFTSRINILKEDSFLRNQFGEFNKNRVKQYGKENVMKIMAEIYNEGSTNAGNK